ncbi:MAG: protein translocase subunit SecF [Methanosarcinales archaeon]
MVSIDLKKHIESYVAKYTIKQLIVIPLVVLLIASSVLLWTYVNTGSPAKLGVDFKGGTIITINTPESPDFLKAKFSEYNIIGAREWGNRKMLQFENTTRDKYRELLDKVKKEYGEDVEIKHMSEIVSVSAQKQAIKAVLIAFIGMAVVVFLIFRTIVPSIAIVLSAFSDIVIAMAFMNIIGIKLTIGTVAALLMLIGYSVDSDILLTNRLLKRKGPIKEKIIKAMETGLTMTMTTLAALGVLFIVSTYSYMVSEFSRIDILTDISVVLIFGLTADLMNTWALNAGILRWYMEKKQQKRRNRT